MAVEEAPRCEELTAADETVETRKRKQRALRPEVQDDSMEATTIAVMNKRLKRLDEAENQVDDPPTGDRVVQRRYRVHVGNLPFAWDEVALRKYFEEECGSVLDVALLMNPLGASRGIAFLTFERKRTLRLALQLDGQVCQGRTIKVSLATGEGERPKTGSAKSKATKSEIAVTGKNKFMENEVFVGGLPYLVEEGAVRKVFEACGDVSFFQLPMNKRGTRDGTSKGFAFVAYKKKSAMEKALRLHGSTFAGRTLVVQIRGQDEPMVAKFKQTRIGTDVAVSAAEGNMDDMVTRQEKCSINLPKKEGMPSGKGRGKGNGEGAKIGNREFEVFVGGLPFDADEVQVRKDFEDCGEILRFSMPKDEKGVSRGIAFINYSCIEAMEKAVKFHETEYYGLMIRVLRADAPRSATARKIASGRDVAAENICLNVTPAANAGLPIGKRRTFESDDD